MKQQRSTLSKNRPNSSKKRKSTQQNNQAAKIRAQIYGPPAGSKTMSTFRQIKSTYPSATYSAYSKKRPSTAKGGKKKKKTKKKIVNGNLVDVANSNAGVMLNNYFPALENAQGFGIEAGNSQMSEENSNATNVRVPFPGYNQKDQRYPKFSADNMNAPNSNYMMPGGDQIDEVPPEQEEGESQEIIQNSQQPIQYHGSFGNKAMLPIN